jgi:branched-chain amino acid transport system substrate-binding protein
MSRLILPPSFNRRKFIKRSAAFGAAVSAGALFAPHVRAQSQTIRIGYVTPQTGPLAGFAEADAVMLEMFREAVGAGIDIGGATYGVEVVVRDSQSNPNRAGEVARELIVDEGVQLMLVASTPETTNPVSTVCELEEMPCISTMAPWEAWYFSRQANPADPSTFEPFRYTYHFFPGATDWFTAYTNMWAQLDVNRNVGGLWPNDADGNAFADPNVGFPPFMANLGYKVIDSGRYANLSDSFQSQIATFQQNDCDILTGLMIPPDFTTFWTQSLQQGYKPPVCTMGRCILFPSAVDALGDQGHNLSTEVWWSPNHPYKSSMNGMTSAQLAQAFSEATGRPWTQPIGFTHALFEVALDVLRRSADPTDLDANVEALAATNVQTIVGPVAFGRDNVAPFAAANVSTTKLVGGQWRLRDGGGYDLVIVDNQTAEEIPLGGEMEAIA